MKVLVIPAEANVLIITLAVQYNSREYKKPGGSLECLRTKVCSWIHLSLELKRAFFPSYGHHCPTVYTHRWVLLEQRLKKSLKDSKIKAWDIFFKFVFFDCFSTSFQSQIASTKSFSLILQCKKWRVPMIQKKFLMIKKK